MSNPLISIIIPVFNPGKHFEKCIESIVSQTYKNLQIILIDDGSTDGSERLCDYYASVDSRILCVHQPNSGVSNARNEGIKRAKGDYYHFLDSDDYLECDTYQYLIEKIERYSFDFINFEYYITYENYEKIHTLSTNYYGQKNKRDAHRIVLTHEPFAANKLFSKKLIQENSQQKKILFREDITYGEDSLFVHQTLERADKIWFDKRPLYHYVQSKNSTARSRFRISKLSALKLYDAYKPLYNENYPDMLPEFNVRMANLLIAFYYEMWSDSQNYYREQKLIIDTLKKKTKEIDKNDYISMKNRTKLFMFLRTPKLFCYVHKYIHKL